MDIASLLAQGVQTRPAGMEQNALMQGQEMQQRKLQMQNALMQMQDMHTQRQLHIAEARRVAQQRASQDALLRGLQPVSGVQANAASGVVGPRPEAASAIGQRPKADPIALIRAGFSKEQIDQIMNADTMGLPEVARTIEQAGPNGPQTAQFDKYGRPVGSAIAKPVQMSMQDVGGRIVPVNPYTQTTPLAKTLSPSERDASARGWAGLKLQENEKNGPKWDPTNMVWTDPRTMKVVPGVGPDGKPLAGKGGTVEERNAAGFATRMTEATKLLDQLESVGRPGYGVAIASGIPMIGGAARTAVSSPEQQQYRQAQEDWVRAKLRKESGAAIGIDEMDNEIKTYFPQPGEPDGVREQKRRARAIATEGMVRASGKAAYQTEVPQMAPANLNSVFDAADAIIGIGNGKR